jgi:plastocyanin
MGRLLAIAFVVAAAGITVVAVNGPGKDKPEDKDARTPGRQASHVARADPGQRTAATGTPGAKPARVGATVRMRRLRFRPESVSIDVGQAVRFVNDDNVAHTVLQDFGPRSGEAALIDSKRILPGQSFRFVARSNGLISYVCTLHPTVMVGQILVERPAA